MLTKQNIKYIQSLQHKKFRDEYNCFIAEGPKVVIELLIADPFNCQGLYMLEKWYSSMDPQLIEKVNHLINFVEEHELSKISQYATSNQVVGVFHKKRPTQNIDCRKGFTLILEDIQDPGNLGTIIRSADWFGVANIICSPNTVDMYNQKVVQSTMASLGNVNIVYTDLHSWLHDHADIMKLATILNGEPLPMHDKPTDAIIMIGNEANGLSRELIALSDKQITIPKWGHAESLNAAVASSIIMYELTR